MNLLDTILSLIAPHECLNCTREGALLCHKCAQALPTVAHSTLESGGTVMARTVYANHAKELIWRLKSGSARATATEIAYLLPLLTEGIVVPVPTASSRVRQRGYDQAKLIARAYARRTGLPYRDHLVRLSQTRQVGATKVQRARQLQNAFRVVRQTQLSCQHIILIDDVSTTGASLNAAANCLLLAGALRVDAVVFAKVA